MPQYIEEEKNKDDYNTGCPTKPYPLCILVLVICIMIQQYSNTIHFKADVLRGKTSTHSFLRSK